MEHGNTKCLVPCAVLKCFIVILCLIPTSALAAKRKVVINERRCSESHDNWAKEDPLGCKASVGAKPYGHGIPSLCPTGSPFWNPAQFMTELHGFAQVYSRRPITVNTFGLNTNHAFSLWFTIRSLKPWHIIESGVWCGQTTWLLREAAGPGAWIYSIDPRPEAMFTYSMKRDDPSSHGHYFTGEHFKDFGEVAWDSIIPRHERERTLVVLDDHQSCLKRAREMLAHGFTHMWYDDNYNCNYGYGDTYSFNLVCSPVPTELPNLSYRGNFAQFSRKITLHEHSKNVRFLADHIEAYVEFPPIWDGCNGNVTNPESLLPSAAHLIRFRLPPIGLDPYHYLHLYPAYVKLRQ